MEQPLPYDYEDMNDLKLFYDENSDGIVEINSLWEPEHNAVGKIYKDYIQVWLQWDGQDSVYAVDAVLENISDGYQFRVPLEWMDMLYYDFRRDEHAVNWVDFYYENARFTTIKLRMDASSSNTSIFVIYVLLLQFSDRKSNGWHLL